jgi:hypothetical protein
VTPDFRVAEFPPTPYVHALTDEDLAALRPGARLQARGRLNSAYARLQAFLDGRGAPRPWQFRVQRNGAGAVLITRVR